jgi:competence protein ComEC
VKLLKGASAFAVGIVIERLLSTSPSTIEVVITLSAAALVVGAAVFAQKHVTVGVLLILAVLGLVRASTAGAGDLEVPWGEIPRNEERVSLEGTLLSDPAPSKDRTRLRLSIESDTSGDTDYFVDVYAERLHDLREAGRRSDDFRYGDTYRFSGRFNLTTGRDDIAGIVSSSNVELLSERNGGSARSLIAGFRANVSHTLVDSLGSKSGGLAAALLVGDRTKLLAETITDFRTAGLSHVLAISGLHIAMVGGIIMAISVWLFGRQRQLYLLAPFAGVWGYAVLAGLTPSVTRAVIMFTVYLLARLLGRQRSVLPPLALAAVVMLVLEPGIAGSISFQLSFAAVLGIALFSARFAARGSGWIQDSESIPVFTKRILTGAVYGMAVSLAATIATAPLVAFHFGEIPIWGVPSTLLVVPVLPLFLGGSVLAAGVSSVVGQSVAVVGVLAHGIGNYMSFVAGWFGSLPIGPVVADGWSVPLIAGWYGIVIYVMNRRAAHARLVWLFDNVQGISVGSPAGTGRRSASRKTIFSVMVVWLVASVSLVGFVLSEPSSTDLTVTFFETNRGDMIIVETPSGVRMLIDGGDDSDLAVRNLESVLPPLDRRIDVVLSTHPDADHLGGLQRVVEQFDVGRIVDSGVVHNSNIYKSWESALRGDDRVVAAQPGMIIALDQDVVFTVLQTGCVRVACSNFNDEGVVGRLEFGEVSFLLTGDATSGAENDLMLAGVDVRSTVLKAGHHGSRTSTTGQFLATVDPTVAVVTTGIKNQFGHPHEDVIERLEEQLTPGAVFVTRDSGTVRVITDGGRVWVEVER